MCANGCCKYGANTFSVDVSPHWSYDTSDSNFRSAVATKYWAIVSTGVPHWVYRAAFYPLEVTMFGIALLPFAFSGHFNIVELGILKAFMSHLQLVFSMGYTFYFILFLKN